MQCEVVGALYERTLRGAFGNARKLAYQERMQ